MEGLITSSRSISFTCCCSISLITGFCLRNGSQTAGPVVWISCSTRDVLLMGWPSFENTSLYSSKRRRRSLCCSKESESRYLRHLISSWRLSKMNRGDSSDFSFRIQSYISLCEVVQLNSYSRALTQSWQTNKSLGQPIAGLKKS